MSKETFDFSEALKRMRQGKKVRRVDWETINSLWINGDKDVSVMYKENDFESFTHTFPNYWNFFSLNDILATDWEEVKNG